VTDGDQRRQVRRSHGALDGAVDAGAQLRLFGQRGPVAVVAADVLGGVVDARERGLRAGFAAQVQVVDGNPDRDLVVGGGRERGGGGAWTDGDGDDGGSDEAGDRRELGREHCEFSLCLNGLI